MVRDEYYAHNQKAMRELNALPLPQLLPAAHLQPEPIHRQ